MPFNILQNDKHTPSAQDERRVALSKIRTTRSRQLIENIHEDPDQITWMLEHIAALEGDTFSRSQDQTRRAVDKVLDAAGIVIARE